LGQNVVDFWTVQRWSAKIRSKNFNLKDELHIERHSDFNDNALKALLTEDLFLTTREIEEKIGFDTTIS